MTTATFGGTTIWVGGGVQFLLPARYQVHRGRTATSRRTAQSDWLDFGGAAGGGIETALGLWGGSRVTGSVKGFLANLETDDRKRLQRLLRRVRSGETGLALRQAARSTPRPTATSIIGAPRRS